MKHFIPIAALAVFLTSCASDNSYVEVPESNRTVIELNESQKEDEAPLAGAYDNALVAIDGKHVSGVYNPGGGCFFYFEGQFSKRKEAFPISWVNPSTKEEGNGSLSMGDDAIVLKISNKSKSCPADLTKDGIRIQFTKASNWKSVKMLKQKNVPIFSEPEEGMELGKSFKKDDIICVLEEKKDWLRVEKIGKNTDAGWIKAKYLN